MLHVYKVLYNGLFDRDKGLPKAMVKPNILTHVIEGYVIQEAGEPFAVNRPLRDWVASAEREQATNRSSEENPRKKQRIDSEGSSSSGAPSAMVAMEAEPTPSTSKATEPPAVEAAESSQPARVVNASKWTVAEVYEFIRKIPGCAGYAKEFLAQEVDGEALLLIKAEHLVMALSIKLGPALKIVACIDALRPENEQTSNESE